MQQSLINLIIDIFVNIEDNLHIDVGFRKKLSHSTYCNLTCLLVWKHEYTSRYAA